MGDGMNTRTSLSQWILIFFISIFSAIFSAALLGIDFQSFDTPSGMIGSLIGGGVVQVFALILLIIPNTLIYGSLTMLFPPSGIAGFIGIAFGITTYLLIKDLIFNQKQSSKLKYISVWFLTGLIIKSAQGVLYVILAKLTANGAYDDTLYFVSMTVSSIPISICVFIIFYNKFPILNIRKVMPYVYILWGLGAVFGAITFNIVLDNKFSFSSLMVIVASLITIYTIRTYYRNKPDRWY
jgi:hypothetical protein